MDENPVQADGDSGWVSPEMVLAQLQSCVAGLFAEHHDVRVLSIQEISAGWESDVYAFDAALDGDQERLVLRIYPGNDATRKSALEYEALRALGRVGYPVPAVYRLVQEGSPFGDGATGRGRPFLIMEWVPGRGMWRETFHGSEEARTAHFDRFCSLLVQLHALDWRAFVAEGTTAFAGDPYASVDAGLVLLRQWLERMGQRGYLPLVDWLAERRESVPCERPAPIHWDFHPENLLLCDDGRVVVIDWTQFQIADPRFDLAWTMTLVGSQEGGDVRERILERYVALSAQPVDQIEVFEVFACVKRLASVTISLAAGAEQLGMRPGAEQSMRQHFPALKRVYRRVQDITGASISEVESMFAGDGR